MEQQGQIIAVCTSANKGERKTDPTGDIVEVVTGAAR
jgi:hypothetical protein